MDLVLIAAVGFIACAILLFSVLYSIRERLDSHDVALAELRDTFDRLQGISNALYRMETALNVQDLRSVADRLRRIESTIDTNAIAVSGMGEAQTAMVEGQTHEIQLLKHVCAALDYANGRAQRNGTR